MSASTRDLRSAPAETAIPVIDLGPYLAGTPLSILSTAVDIRVSL
jgi:hypothetical protein